MNQMKESTGLVAHNLQPKYVADNGTFYAVSPHEKTKGKKKNIVKSSLAVAVIFVILFLTMILLISLNNGPTSSPSSNSKLETSKSILKQSGPIPPTENNGANEEIDINPVIPKVSPELDTTVVINTSLGQIKGYSDSSRDGRKYWSFFKVPYAEPPLDRLRFRSPEPVEAWDGIRDEKEVAPQCIQKVKYSPIDEAKGEEDCLYMNIYTPKIPKNQETEDSSTAPTSSELLSTMVYIHGGGYSDGNGSRYGPEYFMDEDVLLITFQFRLGPLGFLNLGDDRATGNMGFKDQVMALKWIQEHIHNFGGDPKRVTIFGNSGGGMCVSNHLVSPMSEGLFHRAISQSGTTMTNSELIRDPEETVNALAEAVGCKTGRTRRLLRCLRKIDAAELALVRGNNIHFGLTVETHFSSYDDLSDVFMPDTPLNLVRNNKSHNVPWIIGVNSEEAVGSSMALLRTPDVVASLNENWTETAAELLKIDSDAIDESIMTQLIYTFYFKDQKISNKTERELTNLLSDRMWIHSSYLSAMLQSRVNPDSVFLYYLSKSPAKGYARKFVEDYVESQHGAGHADELQFLFPYYGYPVFPPNSEYYPFSKQLVKIFAQFAKDGKPMPTSVEWPAVNPENRPVIWYELNDVPRQTTVLERRMIFWDQFSYSELNYEQEEDNNNLDEE